VVVMITIKTLATAAAVGVWLISYAHAAPDMPNELQGKWCLMDSKVPGVEGTYNLSYNKVGYQDDWSKKHCEELITVTRSGYFTEHDWNCDLVSVSKQGSAIEPRQGAYKHKFYKGPLYRLTFKCSGYRGGDITKTSNEVWQLDGTVLELTQPQN
jgi:hypothetical protein